MASYEDPIQCSHEVRHLEAQLSDDVSSNVISDEKTAVVFQQRRMNKIENITKHTLLKCGSTDPIDEIRCIKTFAMHLAEVFSQVLPTNYLNNISNSIIRSYALACNIHPSRMDVNQFALWAGLSKPVYRWELNSLIFFLKHFKTQKKTFLHKWTLDN